MGFGCKLWNEYSWHILERFPNDFLLWIHSTPQELATKIYKYKTNICQNYIYILSYFVVSVYMITVRELDAYCSYFLCVVAFAAHYWYR